MTNTPSPTTDARSRPTSVARGFGAGDEPVAITDHPQPNARPVSPADAPTSEELRALQAYRARQARGKDDGIPHAEAYRRVFGGEKA